MNNHTVDSVIAHKTLGCSPPVKCTVGVALFCISPWIHKQIYRHLPASKGPFGSPKGGHLGPERITYWVQMRSLWRTWLICVFLSRCLPFFQPQNLYLPKYAEWFRYGVHHPLGSNWKVLVPAYFGDETAPACGKVHARKPGRSGSSSNNLTYLP